MSYSSYPARERLKKKWGAWEGSKEEWVKRGGKYRKVEWKTRGDEKRRE